MKIPYVYIATTVIGAIVVFCVRIIRKTKEINKHPMMRLLHFMRKVIREVEGISDRDMDAYIHIVLYSLDRIISRTENMRTWTLRSARKQEARKTMTLLLKDSIIDYYSFIINDKEAKMYLENLPNDRLRLLSGRADPYNYIGDELRITPNDELRMTPKQHMKRLLDSARGIIEEMERIAEHPDTKEYLNQVLYWLDCIIHRDEKRSITDPFGRKQKAQKTAAIVFKHLIVGVHKSYY